MKLELGKAWDEAVRMLSANGDLLWIIAAAFLFLPALALAVLAPGSELEAAAQDPDQLQAAFMAYASTYWPHIAIYLVLNFVGSLAILAMLGKRNRPTVGEAIKIGVVGLVPYVLTILLLALVAGIIVVIASLLGAATGVTAISITLVVLAIIVIAAFSFRLVLAGPIIAIEQQLNPIAALTRSWHLVKGNTRRVALFVVLITLVATVVSFLVSAVLGLVAALVGAELALWIQGVGSSVLGAVISVVVLSAYAAIYHMLAGPRADYVSETFE